MILKLTIVWLENRTLSQDVSPHLLPPPASFLNSLAVISLLSAWMIYQDTSEGLCMCMEEARFKLDIKKTFITSPTCSPVAQGSQQEGEADRLRSSAYVSW